MATANDFIPAPYTHSIDQGVFQWSAPSNIALVKYWGKKENQIPANPSVSFTLNNCKTITQLAFAKKQNQDPSTFSFDLLFEGKPKEDFKPKIQKFLERIEIYLPFLKDYHFTIDTQNTFPHISQPVRLFENTYRMGSMVFGGGNVLYSMVLTEFVEYRPKQYLTLTEFNTGLGLLQAVPGPTFTIATYANGIAMKKLGYDIYGQLIGCGVGTLAIFLPGTLLIFFVYPIWNQVKTYPIIYRSLDGIISVSIGFLWSAAIFMMMPYFKRSPDFDQNTGVSLLVFGLTLLYLQYKKLPAFILVIVTILAGYLL